MARSLQSQFDSNGLIHSLGSWATTSGPLYRRLADALRACITRGDLSDGQSLPSERVFARQLAVSRSTVVAAYGLLCDERLLERRQGSGTRVRTPASGARRAPYAATPNRVPTRNTLMRRLADGPDTTVDLVGAYLLDVPSLVAEDVGGLEDELRVLSGTSGYAPLGYPPLRQGIAGHLTARGLKTCPEQILVTSGAQQAIFLAACLYVQRGDSVVVEDPTYPGALDAFSSLGARLIGVPTRRLGVDVASLEETVTRASPRLVYVVPTFQNPVGGVLSEHGRRALAALVRKSGMPVVEDDSLSALGFLASEPPPPVAAYAPDEPILTIGSLSKLYWPGLRVGWIRASETTVAQLGRLRAVADLGGSLPAQVIGARLINTYREVREQRRRIILERFELATRLLSELLPSWSWDQPQGGLCLWIRLPYGSAVEFGQVALRHGVSIVAGPVASCDGNFGGYLRLPFGHQPPTLEEGIRRLARAWSAYARPDDVHPHSMAVVV